MTATKEKPFRAEEKFRTGNLSQILETTKACSEAKEWAQQYKTTSEAWLACENPQWMLWALNTIGYKSEKLRLFACWCARNTPISDGRTTWDLLTDRRSRTAVETAELFARGKTTKEERAAAWAAAKAAAEAAAEAAKAAAKAAAWAAAKAAAKAAAEAAAEAAAWAAAWAAQAEALKKIVGNPFK